MAKVKAEDLSGRKLVQAYVMALGQQPVQTDAGGVGYQGVRGEMVEPWITDATAGELIGSAWISVDRPFGGAPVPMFRCVADYKGPQKAFQNKMVVSASAASLGEAVFRCFVASRLGETFELPELQ